MLTSGQNEIIDFIGKKTMTLDQIKNGLPDRKAGPLMRSVYAMGEKGWLDVNDNKVKVTAEGWAAAK